MPASSVCMSRKPTFHSPIFPDARPPPMIGMASPALFNPIRRLKNRSTSPGLPTEKKPAFSRKNGRFADLVDLPEHVRNQLEVAERRWLQAPDRARDRHPIEVELPRDGGPVGFLVLAADVALEIDAPHLVRGRRVTQGLERDGELGHPAELRGLGAHFPRAVPVEVESAPRSRLLVAGQTAAALAFIGDLSVVLHTRGVGAEDEPVLDVLEGVEDHPEAVRVVERAVAPRVRDDDLRRIAVVAHDPDEQGVAGEDQPHLGALGDRLAFVGLVLLEPGNRRCLLPDRIRKHVPVDRRGFRHGRGAGGRTVDRTPRGRGELQGLPKRRGRSKGDCANKGETGRIEPRTTHATSPTE